LSNIVVIMQTDTDQIGKAVIIKWPHVLILKRSMQLEKFPGEWDLAGGHTIEGEDPLDGVLREVWEETGFVLSNPEKLYSDGREAYYKVIVNSEQEVRLSNEHEEYVYATPDEIESYELPDKYLKAIRYALKDILA